jgi:hypothetical protein
MGSLPSDKNFVPEPAYGSWDLVAIEGRGLMSCNYADVWQDGYVEVCVAYRDGKAAIKDMEVAVPPWKLKARAWLYWLRGLVGL